MPAIDWTTIENALAAWALAGSGLPVGQVIWAYQGKPRPEPPYLAMTLADVRSAGRDWRDKQDGTGEHAGKVRVLHRGPRMATLDLQLFAEPTNAVGEQGAVSRMHDLLASIDVHVDALDTGGIGIGDIGGVQLVAGRVNELLEPRAVAEVQLHLFSELESYADYVSRVTGTVNGAAFATEEPEA